MLLFSGQWVPLVIIKCVFTILVSMDVKCWGILIYGCVAVITTWLRSELARNVWCVDGQLNNVNHSTNIQLVKLHKRLSSCRWNIQTNMYKSVVAVLLAVFNLRLEGQLSYLIVFRDCSFLCNTQLTLTLTANTDCPALNVWRYTDVSWIYIATASVPATADFRISSTEVYQHQNGVTVAAV